MKRRRRRRWNKFVVITHDVMTLYYIQHTCFLVDRRVCEVISGSMAHYDIQPESRFSYANGY